MKPLSLKEEAINYRKYGYSYNMISEKLGLAKSTLSYWLGEIPYKPNKEVIKRIKAGPIKAAQNKQREKIATIKFIKRKAKKELGKLTKRDLWLLGIGLYIGEGRKFQEAIQLTNSDPETIKIASKWFREICDLKNENLKPSVHIYPDINTKAVINYWSKIIGVPKKQFGKTQIIRRNNKSKKKRRSLHGTLHLHIKSCGQKRFGKNLHRRIMGWIEAALKQI